MQVGKKQLIAGQRKMSEKPVVLVNLPVNHSANNSKLFLVT